MWWKYKSSVPPLPEPIDFFNGSSQFSRYGWKYDANYVANDYTFSGALLALAVNSSDDASSQRNFNEAFFALTICTVSWLQNCIGALPLLIDGESAIVDRGRICLCPAESLEN